MVTGANDGIGKATSLGLARLGATVVMVCRDLERGRSTQALIKSTSGNDAVELMLADLSSQAAIRQLVADYTRTHARLHVLVNNAGVNVKQRTLTADGIELNFAVNYLAPFLLTLSMVDMLEASGRGSPTGQGDSRERPRVRRTDVLRRLPGHPEGLD
jgi:NAD(P)-dependent dehydrogenase (short-subunit alcohol dehydrogenase family)